MTHVPDESHMELPFEELLRRARPLPPHERMVIDDLTPEEGAAFLEAISRGPSYPVSRGGPMRYDRITVEPDKMGGVHCIRNLRVPVATVVGMVAEGMTTEEILAAYPYLEAADIREALEYAAEAVRERELPLRRGA